MIKMIWMTTAVGAVLAAATPAKAEEAARNAPSTIAPSSSEGSSRDTDASTLSNADLDQLRGGESVVVTNQTLTAMTSGNVINGNYSAGDVSLSDNAFSNFNGLGNVLINTGAQVSLQTGMNVTINVSN
ncbi:MAG TPA: hypothetical protein VHE36_06065 [Sphingomicrobium sp.]|jgi:hypothetical protein|nr:hypothetical protein [Sphingomicrobium sp.]